MAAKGTPSAPPKSDRIPPYSEEAERGVLGSALLDAARVIDLCVERKILPDSFHTPAHRIIYECLLDMNKDGRVIDLLTLGEKLEAADGLERVGGRAYLLELVDSTPTAAHAEHYIEIVRQKHLLRTVIDCSRQAIDDCYDADEDADEILGRAEQRLYDMSDMTGRSLKLWTELIRESMAEIENIFQQRMGVTGIPTGFKDVDTKLMGLQKGDIIIIAARPSMGKTSLAMNIAEKVALGEIKDHIQRPVAVFSLEMSREQLVRRMICCRARVSSHTLSTGYVSAVNHGHLMQAADALMKAPIYIDDTAGLTAVELRARARRLKKRFGIELIVVDYLQLLNYPQYAREGRQRETAAISGALKAMAKELRVPVIVLSQLSRAPETRGSLAIPKLSDLRDSGSIEQDADVVGLLRRPCKYPDDENAHDKTLSILDIAKHRNGPTGEVLLHFEEEYTRFADRAQRGVDHDEAFAPDEEEGIGV
jgi:replicative DNA helicase